MEHKRQSVIDLYLAGKSPPTIVRELKQLDVNKVFVYRTITRYNETGSIAKRHGGGHQKTATTPEMILKVKKRLERNPQRMSANQLAKELKISDRSVRRILNNELKAPSVRNISTEDLKVEIHAILRNADLSTTSSKKVRTDLELKLNCDLIKRKKEIGLIIDQYVSENNPTAGEDLKPSAQKLSVAVTPKVTIEQHLPNPKATTSTSDSDSGSTRMRKKRAKKV